MCLKKMKLAVPILIAILPVRAAHAQRPCCGGPQPLTYWQLPENLNDLVLGYPPSTPATFTATVELIPIKLVFSDGNVSLDPTQPTCTTGTSALQLISNSPLFQPAPFFSNGQYLGTTQFIDAYQHANLGSAISASNHLLFNYRIYGSTSSDHVPSQVLVVPASEGFARPAGCSAAGVVSFSLLANFVNNIFPDLPANTIPVFLVYNTLLNKGSRASPLYEGGEHNYSGILGGPYAFSHFIDDHSIFDGIVSPPLSGNSSDVYSLSHELAELALNPHNNGTSPAWGNIGQFTGCTSVFEIGDPLSGVGFAQYLNGFTYHLTDLAFTSWFFREVPSQGVGGSYSFMGTLTAPASHCP